MSNEQLANRILAEQAGLSSKLLREGKLSAKQMDRVFEVAPQRLAGERDRELERGSAPCQLARGGFADSTVHATDPGPSAAITTFARTAFCAPPRSASTARF